MFELEQDGLVIGFRDDVIIRGNIGHRLKKVWSENGTIELRSSQELVVESVETKRGTVIIAGVVRAKSIKGAKVALLEGSLAVRSVNGESSIDLRGGVIEADLVMSPEVKVSAEVRGRATVIESQNEIGPHQLKGGFKMAEFLEMMPNAQKVIQSEASHIPQLSAGVPRQPVTSRIDVPPPIEEAPAPPTYVGQVSVEDGPAAADGGEPVPEQPTEEPTGPGAEQEAMAAANGTAAVPTDTQDYFAANEAGETAAGVDPSAATQAEVPAEEPPPIERPPFHAPLAENCEQIARVYAAQNLQVPPPVQRLIELVDAGEYAAVKSQLTTIWNQLIQYHKESKLPFAVKTTQMFQAIQRTLQANVQA